MTIEIMYKEYLTIPEMDGNEVSRYLVVCQPLENVYSMVESSSGLYLEVDHNTEVQGRRITQFKIKDIICIKVRK